MQKIEADMAPKLAAQRDTIFLNGPLFKRIETLYNDRAQLGLDENRNG
jgi:peptidyl-dipeptidase Dcp